MNYIFYQTKTKFSNTGDALINKALIDALRKCGTIFANCSKDIPENFLDELGIVPNERMVTSGDVDFALKVIKFSVKKKRGDKVYVVSGLGDVHGGGTKRVAKNILSSGVFLLYRLLGVRSVRIGRSIGKISKGMEFAEKIRGKVVNYNYVRDMRSLKKLENLGVKKARYCPDMSWMYLSNKEKSYNKTNTVVINMRGSTLGKYEEEYVAKIKPLCREVVETISKNFGKEMKICFAYQVEEDKKITNELYEMFKGDYDCTIVEKRLGLSDVEDVYKDVAFHISNRMHSLLLGYKYGSLPIALIDKEKHLKIVSTFDDIGLMELVVNISEPDKLENVVGNIISKKEVLYYELLKCEDRMVNKTLEELSSIMEVEQINR